MSGRWQMATHELLKSKACWSNLRDAVATALNNEMTTLVFVNNIKNPSPLFVNPEIKENSKYSIINLNF